MMEQFSIEREAPKKNELDDVEFFEEPVSCNCPHCKKLIVSTVEYRSGWMTIVLCIFAFLLLGWLAFCVLPFIFPLFQECCHYCPQCQNRIAKRQRVRFPQISNEVMTLRCGSCAVVLSRKYVIFFVVMVSLIAIVNCIRWYINNVGLPDIPKGPHIENTWQDFLDDCSLRSYLGNPIHATSAFANSYYRSTVVWEGKVNKVQEGYFSKNFLFLTMEPSQFPPDFRRQPDLAMIFSKTLDPKVAELHIDDRIRFESTLLELGRRGRPHLGILWDFNITSKYNDISQRFLGGGQHPMGLFDVAREMSRLQPRITFIRLFNDDDADDDADVVSDGGLKVMPKRMHHIDEDDDDDEDIMIVNPFEGLHHIMQLMQQDHLHNAPHRPNQEIHVRQVHPEEAQHHPAPRADIADPVVVGEVHPEQRHAEQKHAEHNDAEKKHAEHNDAEKKHVEHNDAEQRHAQSPRGGEQPNSSVGGK